MEAVAAGDEVALELLAAEGDARSLAVRRVHRDVLDLEVDRDAAIEQRGDLVLDHLLLAVDRDLAAGQPEHVDVEDALPEAHVDAGVVKALAREPLSHPDRVQHVDGVLLEQARADALLDVLAAARLEHDALDPRLLQVERQREARGPGADDADLRFHSAHNG